MIVPWGHRRFSQSQRAGVRWRKGFSFRSERTDFILPGENRRCSDMPDTGIMIKAFPVLQKVPGERSRSGNIWRLRAFMSVSEKHSENASMMNERRLKEKTR